MIDDTRRFPSGSPLQSDVCTVGGRVPGITISPRSPSSGLHVLLLEAGGLAAEIEVPSQGEAVDPAPHAPPGRYRQRKHGVGNFVVRLHRRVTDSAAKPVCATPFRNGSHEPDRYASAAVIH